MYSSESAHRDSHDTNKVGMKTKENWKYPNRKTPVVENVIQTADGYLT